MYKISELAEKVGVSRTTILYYEKQKLITGDRLENGYRIYSDNDLQQLRLIQQLHLGGLTLKECKECIEKKIDRELLLERLKALDEEIEQKQQARNLLAAIAGKSSLKAWHEGLNKIAPDAHLDWLITQGFDEKQALHLKWLSKDMNEHDLYMADFMNVFDTLERWGPGSETDTKKALSLVPKTPTNILEVGCGKGLATKVLAKYSKAKITALDNEQSALDSLMQRFKQDGIPERLETVCESMSKLPFPKESFDLIWAEGSAYIIGVEKALALWKPTLKKQGYLMFSDMVWRTETPNKKSVEFWSQEYPDIQLVNTRLEQIEQAGYKVITHFPQSKEAWLNYYIPLQQRLTELESEMRNSTAYADIANEVNICTQFDSDFGYHMFLLEKTNYP